MDATLSPLQAAIGVCIICIAALALVIGWCIKENRRRDRLAAVWEDIAEGDFDRVEYGDDEWWERRQRTAMAARDENVRRHLRLTVVYLTDGRAYMMKGRHDAPFARGSRVFVRQNGLGERRLAVTPSELLH